MEVFNVRRNREPQILNSESIFQPSVLLILSLATGSALPHPPFGKTVARNF